MHPVKNSQTRSDSELDCRTLESDFFPFPQSSLFVVQEHFWLVKINDAYLFQPYVREGWGGWGGSGSWGGKGAQALEGWLIESKREVTQKRLNFQCRSLLEKTLAITDFYYALNAFDFWRNHIWNRIWFHFFCNSSSALFPHCIIIKPETRSCFFFGTE